MITILGKVTMQGLPQFLSVFATKGREMRRKHGSIASAVYRVPDDPERLYVLLEWESREGFEAFLNDPDVRETMQSGGTVGRPEFVVLEKVGDFPG